MSVTANRQELRLLDAADATGLIEGRTFEDAIILGPAIVVPLDDVTFDSNTWVIDPSGLFLELPEGRSIQGAIGLRHVTIRRCELRNIAIAGTPDVIARLRAQFQFPEAATLATLEANPGLVQG